jgi:hypothetical protein
MPTVGRVRTYSLCPSRTGKALPARSRDPGVPVEHVTDPRGHVPRPAQDDAGNVRQHLAVWLTRDLGTRGDERDTPEKTASCPSTSLCHPVRS